MRKPCKHEPVARKRLIVSWMTDESGNPIDLGDQPDYTGWWVYGVCEYGNCTETNCPVCGCNRGGWGPILCPCEDWIPYRDMRHRLHHAPIKPSVAGRSPGRRRGRKWRKVPRR